MKIGEIFQREEGYFSLFFLGDLGLGNLFGGFGLLFWGLGFPAFIYLFILGLREFSPLFLSNRQQAVGTGEGVPSGRWFSFFFWGQLGFGLLFLFYYARSTELLFRSGRLVLFVAGLGLVALSVVWPKISNEVRGSEKFLKFICIGSAVLTLILLGGFRDPQYDLSEPLQDRIQGLVSTPYKYLYLGGALEPLDILTQDGSGLNVYVAGPWEFFFTAPFYGLKLQNRVWNFEGNIASDPEALVFHQTEPYQELFYVGKRITPKEAALNPEYVMVTQDDTVLFFLKKSVLNDSQMKERLMDFYRGIASDFFFMGRSLASQLEEDALILASAPFGYGLKFLEMNGEVSQRIILIPEGTENEIAPRVYTGTPVYTFRQPADRFKSTHFIDLFVNGMTISVYRNIK